MSQGAMLDYARDLLARAQDAVRKCDPHEPALTYYRRAERQILHALDNLGAARMLEYRRESSSGTVRRP